jgi:Caspase domain
MFPTFSFMIFKVFHIHRRGCCLSMLLGAFITLALFSSSHRAQAETRVALVIGNSVYKKASSLPNPIHDAEDTAAALQRLGFKVSAFHDADFSAFRKAILDFNRAAQGADIAVVYFAGHGIEVDGENWLLPTDVELRNDVDAATEAISLRSVMSAVGPAKTLGLVILDACRNNPFQSTMQRSAATREARVGLRAVETSDNVLVAYAARDGTVAVDGLGRNSPFTSALLRHLETPGLEVDFLFRNVRDDVRAATKDAQQPFVYGSLSSEEIYLNPPRIDQAEQAGAADAAEVAWSFLKITSDVGALTRFSDRFPASAFASEARARIASLSAMAMSSPEVDKTNDRPTFTGNVPDNAELEEAEKAIARRFMHDGPAVKAAWDIIKESKDHAVIRRFVDQFPSGQRRLTADQRLADLGEHPITPRTTNFRPVAPPFAPATAPFATEGGMPPDEMAAVAARDQDVLECFRTGDGGSCERAMRRYPELPRLPANPLFVIGICGSLGQSTDGCRVFVDTNWHFPAPKKVVTADVGVGDVGVGAGGGGNGSGGGAGSGGNGNGGSGSGNGGGAGGGNESGGGNGGGGDIHGHDHDRHHRHDRDGSLRRSANVISEAEKDQKNLSGGAAAKAGNARSAHVRTSHVKLDAAVATPDVKVSNPKVTGANAHVSHVVSPAVNAPRVNVPATRTPTVNVRVPTINVPVRIPGH